MGSALHRRSGAQYASPRQSPLVLYGEEDSAADTASDGDVEIVPALQASQLLCMGRSPLGVSFAQKLRPLLDVVDRLRSLGVSSEGVNLPTIVVVGDQSSGKSSVLESLSGVELPKGQGTVTRVPLVLRLKGSSYTRTSTTTTTAASSALRLATKISLSYSNKEIEISEEEIPAAISKATTELAGPGKAIANKPITLNVCKPGVPDLTLVDLPGITRVPIHGQPSNIFDQIKELILQYITPEEAIILNVLNAAMDFSVCESISMSRQVDPLGKRTLAVVTKVDMCPDSLLQKITDDAVKIGLGYICVRNRTTKEASFQEAQAAEDKLFSSHAELKMLSKSMVGIDALASRLVHLQTQAISDVLPTVLKKIDSSLQAKRQELQQLSGDICNIVDASVAFFNVSCSVRKSLEDVLLSGHDWNDDVNAGSSPVENTNSRLNYSASLHAEFEKFSQKLTNESGAKLVRTETQGGYLGTIQRLLSECLGTNLPNVVPQAIIEKMVRELLDSIANTCTLELPSFVHDAARKVAFCVITKHVVRFPNLKKLYTGAFQRALGECKNKCSDSITRLLEMEKAIVYTTSSDLYNSLLGKLVQAAPIGTYLGGRSSYVVRIEGLVNSLDMAAVAALGEEATKQAACSVLAYWMLLSRRLADQVCHELRFSFNEALLKVADEVVVEVVGQYYSSAAGGGGEQQLISNKMEEIMAEQPEVAHERLRLRRSIDMLSKSKDLISEVLGDAFSSTN